MAKTATKKTATKKVVKKATNKVIIKPEKLTFEILEKEFSNAFLKMIHQYISEAPTVKVAKSNISVFEKYLEYLQEGLDIALDEME